MTNELQRNGRYDHIYKDYSMPDKSLKNYALASENKGQIHSKVLTEADNSQKHSMKLCIGCYEISSSLHLHSITSKRSMTINAADNFWRKRNH